MTVGPPNFSPFPFERLSRISRDQAAIESALARFVAAFRSRPTEHLASLLGGPLRLRSAQLAERAFDPHAAFAELRLGALAIVVAGSGGGVRAIAQRLLGGMAELAATRAPTVADQAVWSLVVAAALADLGIAADVWPLAESAKQTLSRESSTPRPQPVGPQWIGRGGLETSQPRDPAPTRDQRDQVAQPASSAIAVAAPIAYAQTIAGKRSIERKPIEDRAAVAHAATNPAPPAAQPKEVEAVSGEHGAGQHGARTTGQAVSGEHAAGQHRARTTGQAVSGEHAAGQHRAGTTGQPSVSGLIPIELSAEIAGIPITAIAWCPADLLLRAPPPRPLPTWALELPIVVARCALERSAVEALTMRDVIVVEPGLELRLGDGALGLSAPPNALEARVAIEYRARDMALPDAAHLELTVRLGSVQMSLRRVGELAVGEVIGLGKPLAGPYEIYADNRAIGTGELVDLDGEVGVRIVSLTQE